MNKKIKVIELLKQMEIKENLPKQIKYKNKVFDLICSDDGIHYYANENWSMMSWIDNFYQLYEYVEIIEDEEEIDIQSIEEVNHYNIVSAIKGKTEENIDNELKLNSLAINKLIKAVKQLDKNIKELR